MFGTYAALVLLQGEESTSIWHTIVGNLPRDPASLVTLALCVGVVVLVLKTGVSSNKKKGGPPGQPS